MANEKKYVSGSQVFDVYANKTAPISSRDSSVTVYISGAYTLDLDSTIQVVFIPYSY